jgi:hypothetical protein
MLIPFLGVETRARDTEMPTPIWRRVTRTRSLDILCSLNARVWIYSLNFHIKKIITRISLNLMNSRGNQ